MVWQQLQQKLKEHKGFWQSGSMRYWFHQNDQDIVDRRDGGSNDKKQGTM